MDRTLTVQVDGDAGHTLTLPPTANWDTWGLATVPVDLTAGRHEISVVRGPSDSGNVNVDSLAVVNPGDSFPAPTPPQPQPLRFGTLAEAETGALTGGARPANDHNGASGTGFLAGLESTSSADALTVTDVPSAGDYQVQIRYANGQAGAQPSQTRTMSVTAGTAAPVTATLPPTSGWDYWNTVSVPVHLDRGTNTVTLGCPTDASCNVNVDTVAVTSKGAPLLAPHAPLGGYRRGLDGVTAVPALTARACSTRTAGTCSTTRPRP